MFATFISAESKISLDGALALRIKMQGSNTAVYFETEEQLLAFKDAVAALTWGKGERA